MGQQSDKPERPGTLQFASRAFGHRNYRLFFTGQGVSLIGTWMQQIAMSWLVYRLTGSASLLGLIAFISMAPMFFATSIAGVFIDRWDRRHLLLATNSFAMTQAAILAVLTLTGQIAVWHIFVLGFCLGLVNAFDMPTRQSFVIDMVERKQDLNNAIALNSAMFNGARMIGPAVAGLLVDRFGVAPAFGLNGLSFVAVILALAAMRTEGLPREREGTTVRQDIAAGLRYAVGTPQVALILTLLLVVSLFVINHNVLVPLLARDVLHEGAHGFGLLMAALGIGAVVGALALAMLGRSRPTVPLLITAAALAAALTLALAAIRHFPAAVVLLALTGLAQIVFMASCNTALQMVVPDRLRGRIMSLYAFVFVGVTPIGSFFVGSVAEWFGTPMAYAAGGGLGLLSVLALALLWWRGWGRNTLYPEV